MLFWIRENSVESSPSKIVRICLIGTVSSSMLRFRGPLLKALSNAGLRVYAFAIDYDSAREKEVRDLGAIPVNYSMERTGTGPLADLRSTYQLVRLLKKYDIDIALSYFMKPVVYGSIAASLAGVKQRYAMLPGLGYAFTDTGAAPTVKQRFLSMLLTSMLRFSLAQNKKLFVYNADDEAEILRRKLVPIDKIHRLGGTGIDLCAYPASPPRLSPITFVLIARLLKEKGIREYAEAARLVRKDRPSVRVVLVGGLDTSPGALSELEVMQWVKEGVLEWPGQVPDVRTWLKQTSVYVLPSYREGVPRSTQEALAMARPVITTDAPGCKETVIDGDNGYLVPVRNSQALANAMIRFIEQPELIETMGKQSRLLAEEKFDVHKINAVLLREMGLTP